MKRVSVFYVGTAIVICLVISFNLNLKTFIEVRFKLDSKPKVFKAKNSNHTINIPTIYRGDCKVMSIDSLKNFSHENKFPNGVSKILHFVSNEEEISKDYKQLYKTCATINNDMRVVLWTDASFYTVFVTQFDQAEVDRWKGIFSELDQPIRTVIIRAMVLIVYGGVSLSLETTCQKPMREAMGQNSCRVSVGNSMRSNIEFNEEHNFGESMFACAAGHQFLMNLLTNEQRYSMDQSYFNSHFQYFNRMHRDLTVETFDTKVIEEILPKDEMKRICSKNITGINRTKACNTLNSYHKTGSSTSLMVYQHIYGISKLQMVADDICSLGFAVHIVIV